MSRQIIFNMINSEREYQDSKWGTDFDDQNTPNDWVAYITSYASRASAMDLTPEDFEIAMVKVAALAVAAIETLRRNGQLAARHYDEAITEEFGGRPVTFDSLPEVEGLTLRDISSEAVRQYEAAGVGAYTIENPVGLYTRDGGTTHRVVDSNGVVHCVPFPNEGRTVLRWQNRDLSVPCNF